jgi:hypothetical protein
MAAFDEACDDGAGAEGAFHHGIAAEPAFQPVAQGAEVEQGGGVGDGVKAPDQGGVIGGDEAQGGKALFFHAFCDQKRQCLHRVAASKAVDAQVFAPVMGEGFHQQAVWAGQA